MAEERRISPRSKRLLRFEYHVGGLPVRALSSNVSSIGAFLCATNIPAEGSTISLRFTMSSDPSEAVTISAKVVRAIQVPSATEPNRGIAIAWNEASCLGKSKGLEEFLSQIPGLSGVEIASVATPDGNRAFRYTFPQRHLPEPAASPARTPTPSPMPATPAAPARPATVPAMPAAGALRSPTQAGMPAAAPPARPATVPAMPAMPAAGPLRSPTQSAMPAVPARAAAPPAEELSIAELLGFLDDQAEDGDDDDDETGPPTQPVDAPPDLLDELFAEPEVVPPPPRPARTTPPAGAPRPGGGSALPPGSHTDPIAARFVAGPPPGREDTFDADDLLEDLVEPSPEPEELPLSDLADLDSALSGGAPSGGSSLPPAFGSAGGSAGPGDWRRALKFPEPFAHAPREEAPSGGGSGGTAPDAGESEEGVGSGLVAVQIPVVLTWSGKSLPADITHLSDTQLRVAVRGESPAVYARVTVGFPSRGKKKGFDCEIATTVSRARPNREHEGAGAYLSLRLAMQNPPGQLKAYRKIVDGAKG